MRLGNRYYNPYKIGRRIYREGKGISDLWGAVKCDKDLIEAHKGYEYELERDKLKQIKSKLGYSRIGLGNV